MGPLPADFAAYVKEFGWVTVGPHEVLGFGPGVEWHQILLERARELWRGEGGHRLPGRIDRDIFTAIEAAVTEARGRQPTPTSLTTPSRRCAVPVGTRYSLA